jgi:hypothetical protein
MSASTAPITDALVCPTCDVPIVYQSVNGVVRECCLLCANAVNPRMGWPLDKPFVIGGVRRSDMQRRRNERAA